MMDAGSFDNQQQRYCSEAQNRACEKLWLGLGLTGSDAHILLVMKEPPWVVLWQQSLNGRAWAVKLAWRDLIDKVMGGLRQFPRF